MTYNTYIVITLAIGIACFVIGMWIGIEISEQTAVEAGHAKYNEKTKEFEWKEIDTGETS